MESPSPDRPGRLPRVDDVEAIWRAQSRRSESESHSTVIARLAAAIPANAATVDSACGAVRSTFELLALASAPGPLAESATIALDSASSRVHGYSSRHVSPASRIGGRDIKIAWSPFGLPSSKASVKLTGNMRSAYTCSHIDSGEKCKNTTPHGHPGLCSLHEEVLGRKISRMLERIPRGSSATPVVRLRGDAALTQPQALRLAEVHHAAIYGIMQRSFTDAINGLLAIPRAERTRADQLRYLVLTRAVIFIDIYHNLLNDGPYKIVELLLNAIADVLELCSAGFEVAAQAASDVLCSISHFFAAFGVTLQDPSQPWVPVVAGALAGLGTAGVVIGSGAAVPGPGWVVAATTAFGAAIAYGLSRYFAPPMVVAHVAVEPLDSTEGPLTTLPPPAPELPV